MSYTEINDEKGMRFGSIPYDEIIKKQEETDPELVDEVRGEDFLHDVRGEYDEYARREIIDWSTDAPFMESDHARRDPAWSRSELNLRYNGTRGSSPELPRHPELFYGFTGNDPRGVVNEPRFDQVRGQIDSRAANLTVRFGQNSDQFLAKRPWTNQSISYGMKELHKRLRNNTKVFTPQKEGRAFGRNVVLDDLITGHHRKLQTGDGSDGLQDTRPAGAREDTSTAPERFFASDYGLASDATDGGMRGVDRQADADNAPWRNGRIDADFQAQMRNDTRRGNGPATDEAPWRNSIGDADLQVQQYGQARGQGRNDVGSAAVGGAKASNVAMDQDSGQMMTARGANRQLLGATLAAAARYSKIARQGTPDAEYGASHTAAAAGKAGVQRDVAVAYRSQTGDRAPTRIRDDEGGRLGSAAGLIPAQHPGRAVRSTAVSHSIANPHLANTEAIVRGLREGTASGRRRIANEVIAAGVRSTALAESQSAQGRGLAPAADPTTAMRRFVESPIILTGAAKGLEINMYKAAAPRVSSRRDGHTSGELGVSAERLRGGKSARQEFLGHTRAPVELGADVFGSNIAPDSRGVSGVRTTVVRPTEAGEDIQSRDEIGGMGDIF